jgi:hypothetical protein
MRAGTIHSCAISSEAVGSPSPEIGRGLAPVESGAGTLISFSTQPGNVALDGAGRNSPYSGALVRHLGTSGEDLNAILIAVRNDVMRHDGSQAGAVGTFGADPTVLLQSGRSNVSCQPPADHLRLSEASQAWSATKDTANLDLLDAFVARTATHFSLSWRVHGSRNCERPTAPPRLTLPKGTSGSSCICPPDRASYSPSHMRWQGAYLRASARINRCRDASVWNDKRSFDPSQIQLRRRHGCRARPAIPKQ